MEITFNENVELNNQTSEISKIPKIRINYLINKIPLNIFQTWHTKKQIPIKMHKAISSIRLRNPEFKYYFFDDNDSREFIRKNFKSEVLYAYDSLIPGAYKADLWRYCILYIFGGIYIDIKYQMANNNFKLINLINKEHYVLDADKRGVYNAFMICRPGNELLFKAINMIVHNVKLKFYGDGFLDPTGPMLLAKVISVNDTRVDLTHLELKENNNNKVIIFKNLIILNSYRGHVDDRIKCSKTSHYSTLWKDKKIYKK